MSGMPVLLPLFLFAILGTTPAPEKPAGSASKLGEWKPGDEAPLNAAQKEAATGTYVGAAGRTIWIGPFGEFGAELYFLDFASGRFGALYPRSPTRFVAGPGIVQPAFPIAATLDLETDPGGAATALLYQEQEGPAFRATRQPPLRQNVSFRNGDVTLAGTLTLPRTKSPHPAVVLLHGSGPEDRNFLGPWIDFFARHGFAVLAYDKRGVGASGGNWKVAGFDELAGDGRAAFELLAARPEIDGRRIGLFGISQGGWLAPLLAARIPEVAFVVLHSGASVTPARQGQLHLEHELRAYGVPEAQILEGLAFQRLDDEFTRSGKGWDELEATYRKAAEAHAPWVYADLRPANDEFRTMFRRMLDFDPIPAWRKVKCPVLTFFGELDLQVPPAPNADLLRQTLTEAGQSRFRIVVLPKANHLFLQAGNGTMAEYPGLRAFEPSYFRQLAAWLGEIVPSLRTR